MKYLLSLILAMVAGVSAFGQAATGPLAANLTGVIGHECLPGTLITNNNVNAVVIFTNNLVSISVNSSGLFTWTNYAGAGLGGTFSTNGTFTGNVLKHVSTTAWMSIGGNDALFGNSQNVIVKGASSGLSFRSSDDTTRITLTSTQFASTVPIVLATNALSTWPTVAASAGGAAVVNSNATLYVLTSTPASTAWAATNKWFP